MNRKTRSTALVPRITFRKLFEDTRLAAAESLWQRAIQVSKLRHLARVHEKARLARRLGEVKAKLIYEVCKLVPELVRIRHASDHDRLFSVHFRTSRLHLPLRLLKW
jgi:hypothetical protein